MPHRRPLTPDEEIRCLEFLNLMGIKDKNHRVLSDRGFFGIFLSGLTPDDVRRDGASVERQEIQEVIRLLAIAGAESIRELLDRQEPSHSSEVTQTPPSAPPSTAVNQSSGGVSRVVPSESVEESEPIRNYQYHKTKELVALRPTEAEREILRRLEHPKTEEEARAIAHRHLQEGKFHEAYHILVDFILHVKVSEDVLHEATNVILAASRYDRVKGQSPENMLYECEEMAAILSRKIPAMSRLKDLRDKDLTERIYRVIKLVYKTWGVHCRALIEYRYKSADGSWMQRNWIDPRDFGFLVEMMRMGVKSRLPLDLLQFIYIETRKCVDLGLEVIAHNDKKAKFRGDVLRIIASPTRDIIPDMTFAIFKDIVNAYLEENDTETALIFCKQALMIRQHDLEMSQLKTQLEELGASRMRGGARRGSH